MTTRRAFLAGSSAAIFAGVAPRPAWGQTEVDVAIIGAGLAGLGGAPEHGGEGGGKGGAGQQALLKGQRGLPGHRPPVLLGQLDPGDRAQDQVLLTGFARSRTQGGGQEPATHRAASRGALDAEHRHVLAHKGHRAAHVVGW